jgi:hypothetical protein
VPMALIGRRAASIRPRMLPAEASMHDAAFIELPIVHQPRQHLRTQLSLVRRHARHAGANELSNKGVTSGYMLPTARRSRCQHEDRHRGQG